jgi:hypothetical protein
MVPSSCDATPGSLEFFTNLTEASPRPPGTHWFDYSLQLSTGFRNFCEKNKTYSQCVTAPPPAPASAAAPAASPAATMEGRTWAKPER